MKLSFSLLAAVASLACLPSVFALPQEVGIVPLFGGMAPDDRDLTEGFLSTEAWEDGKELPGHWSELKEMGPWQVAHLEKAPILFGHRPIGVEVSYRREGLARVSIYYLEAGTYFGYNPALKATEEGKRELQEMERIFKQAFKEIDDDLTETLEDLTDAKGDWLTEGTTRMMQRRFRQYEHDNLAIQLRSVEKHFIRLDLLRKKDVGESFLVQSLADLSRKERAAFASEKVRRASDGQVTITGVPMVPQGGRAYCGITTYLMVARYMGIELDPATLASVSGFRYGMGGGKMIETYTAAAREGEVRMSRTAKFDFERAKKAIDEGIPVLVWRKYDSRRDRLHRSRSRRELPDPDEADRKTWPGTEAPNHASVITGYDPKRNEVYFAESWGDEARDKRMRVEEMEATAYKTFYFRL